MTWSQTRHQAEQISGNDVENHSGEHGEKPGSKEPPAKHPFCRALRCGFVALLLLLYGAVLLAVVGKNYSTPPESQVAPSGPSLNCTALLSPIPSEDIMEKIFAGKWILQEAYSSDPIDQYALTNANSSWAEFTRDAYGTIYLHMSHMRIHPNRTISCVYHHFPNITVSSNTLHLRVPHVNATAEFQFLKACNECLVMTAKAFVPGYVPLDYLLAYGLHPELDPYYLRPTVKQEASCKGLAPPAPFQYKGGDFCPTDDVVDDGQSRKTMTEMDLRSIFFPRLS